MSLIAHFKTSGITQKKPKHYFINMDIAMGYDYQKHNNMQIYHSFPHK